MFGGEKFKMEQNYIAHHGTKGMRWGIRRFQNKDGSLTKAGRKRYGVDGDEETKAQYEARKKAALSSGSAKEVLKFKGDLTNSELQTVVTRLNYEKQLSQIRDDEIGPVKSRIDSFNETVRKGSETLDNVNKFAQKGMDVWNTTAKIVNSLSDADLPVLDGGDSRKKKAEEAKKKREEKEAEERKKFIETAKPHEVVKNFGKLSVDDLSQINKRFTYEENIMKRHSSDTEAARSYVNNSTKVNDISNEQTKAGESFIAGLLPPPKEDDK